MKMRGGFCNRHEELSRTLECLACPSIYPTVIAERHISAKFNESVGWFMWTLEASVLCYTRINASRRGAKIHGKGDSPVLGGTI